MKYPVVEKERVKRKMTTGEIAALLGVCRKTYYNWQRNGNMPQRAVEILMNRFGVSADYLLSRVMLAGEEYGMNNCRKNLRKL